MKLFLLIMLFFGTQVFAQVVDMRAFSRQRGYRAYGGGQVPAPMPPVRSYPVQKRAEIPSAENKTETIPVPESSVSENQNREVPVPDQLSADSKDMEKLRQKGIKIFQEQDEDKVMNFVVENPEFKKLNKKQQQDLLKRIKYEKEKVGAAKP